MDRRLRLIRDIAGSLHFLVLDNVHLHPTLVLIDVAGLEVLLRLHKEGMPHAGLAVEVDSRLDIAVARLRAVRGRPGPQFARPTFCCLNHARKGRIVLRIGPDGEEAPRDRNGFYTLDRETAPAGYPRVAMAPFGGVERGAGELVGPDERVSGRRAGAGRTDVRVG